MNSHNFHASTICALSTGQGGAIAVIRVTGKDTFSIVNKIFSKDISGVPANTVHFGTIKNGEEIIDEVLVTVFRSPNSFTGEDLVEISCHASKFIQQEILHLLLTNGCEAAAAGEFTMRAFMNGKMDLSQAEAVADLICSQSKAAHKLAIQQLRGGFSDEIKKLRDELIHFASMIELELDFAEEDVEFADRAKLLVLVDSICKIVTHLIDSFAYGNAIKNGIPVVIVGVPNVGKSTLLNALLNENKAIVSEIAGTTRDIIEDEVVINGVEFRFIDTAGLRETKDIIENIGIEKAWQKINEATIILYLVDAVESSREEILKTVDAFKTKIAKQDKKIVVVANKIDKFSVEKVEKVLKVGLRGSARDGEYASPKVEEVLKVSGMEKFDGIENVIGISARDGFGMDELKKELYEYVSSNEFSHEGVVVTNARHKNALERAAVALADVRKGLVNGTTGDFVAADIRKALYHLGEITGEITTDDLLGNIFSKFCIGK